MGPNPGLFYSAEVRHEAVFGGVFQSEGSSGMAIFPQGRGHGKEKGGTRASNRGKFEMSRVKGNRNDLWHKEGEGNHKVEKPESTHMKQSGVKGSSCKAREVEGEPPKKGGEQGGPKEKGREVAQRSSHHKDRGEAAAPHIRHMASAPSLISPA